MSSVRSDARTADTNEFTLVHAPLAIRSKCEHKEPNFLSAIWRKESETSEMVFRSRCPFKSTASQRPAF